MLHLANYWRVKLDEISTSECENVNRFREIRICMTSLNLVM